MMNPSASVQSITLGEVDVDSDGDGDDEVDVDTDGDDDGGTKISHQNMTFDFLIVIRIHRSAYSMSTL